VKNRFPAFADTGDGRFRSVVGPESSGICQVGSSYYVAIDGDVFRLGRFKPSPAEPSEEAWIKMKGARAKEIASVICEEPLVEEARNAIAAKTRRRL
jgi:hypothetical protein